MFNLGVPEWILILLLVLLLFGAKRLPDIGRGLGEAITSFKKGIREGGEKDSTKDANADPKP